MPLQQCSFQIAFDVAIVHFCSWRSLAYLLLGTMLAMGLHPSAGHFVAEHYVFNPGQETYSYHGFWNLVLYKYVAGTYRPLDQIFLASDTTSSTVGTWFCFND